MKDQKLTEVSKEEIKDLAEELIKEHRMGDAICKDCIGYKYNRGLGIIGAKITAIRLAKETGKKLHYELINYLIKEYQKTL